MDLPPPPRRRWGQNFLVDPGAARRIVAALGPSRGEGVLEIGPGRGALTTELIRAAGRIAAVELDRALASRLRERFDADRLVLFEADVLEVPLEEIRVALGLPAGRGLVLAGNLPFNISKPVAIKLVRERDTVARAVLTFQREVVERLVARPGSRAYGPLGILVGEAFEVERRFDLPPEAFRPRPKVVSTTCSWRRRPLAALAPEEESALRACLSACFAQRRRTLLNNLRAALPGGEPAALSLLARAGIDPRLRAEAVSPEGFRRLARAWPGP